MSLKHRGLFIGLTTLDAIYLVPAPLGVNQKQVAEDYQLSPGGPATNAAVTFAQLGHPEKNQAQLAAVIGRHPLTHIIRADANQWDATLLDLAPEHREPPSLSSILVNALSGERAIVSINAQRHQVAVPDQTDLLTFLEDLDILLIDGHQMAISAALAPLAQQRNIPVVVDGGSWKPGFETVLRATDYAICSANFRAPDCDRPEQTLTYLQSLGIPYIAFTHGNDPITYWYKTAENPTGTASGSHYSGGQISVPAVQAVDTLGAGDIFHGAFCHYILEQDFSLALKKAAAIASQSCQSFGTRSWLEIL